MLERKNTAVPPPPPDDLAARCRATIPIAPEVHRKPTRRRLLTITAGASLAVILGVVELARSGRTPQAVPSPNNGVAFAETVRAMQRVTFFHRTGAGLNFDTAPHWKYLTTRYTNDEWFDARRGLYERTHGPLGHSPSPINDYGTLTLPKGQLYIRSGDDIMIHDHSQRAQWGEVKKNKIREITDPSGFGHGIGSGMGVVEPAIPSASRVALWHGNRSICFTFLASPVAEKVNPRLNAAERADEHELWKVVVPKDAPTLRSEVYVDLNTHRVCAVQKYARFAALSVQPEQLVCEYTYDYDHRPEDALFSPSTILKGAKEIEDFRASHGKEIPVITHPHAR